MPLHALAEGRNQSIASLLHDITGLSKARISLGNLDTIRPSTQKKIDWNLEKLLQDQFKDNPKGLQDLRSKIAEAPELRPKELAPLAGWIHQLEFLPWIPLPITKGVARTIDVLLGELLICCRKDDLRGFKSVLLAHFEHHGKSVRTSGLVATESVPSSDLAILHAISDWEQSENWIRPFADHLYWDLISTLDAEWNSHYFAGRQTKPLFPLVMVRPQQGLLEGMKVETRRNIFFKPVRRLLEFLYAWAFYLRYRKWPLNAPTPKTLAGILYRPGSVEMADKSLISNYFDGTTNLTLHLALEHWAQLRQHFMPNRPENDRPNPPLPMIMLALQWQTLLVLDSGRSFLMPDIKNYETLWCLRREQWATLSAQHDGGFTKAGPSTGEAIDWPVWSCTQSSSSS